MSEDIHCGCNQEHIATQPLLSTFKIFCHTFIYSNGSLPATLLAYRMSSAVC